ncbi:MAG: hypothetical protein VZR95_04230 [Alphaproteobacteria bacterium]
MRKYLLLATTAMLFSTNAMAASYDDASATVNLKATIGQGCTFKNAADMDFKTIVLKPGSGESVELSMSSDGTVSTSSERVITFTTAGTPGSITVHCPTGLTANASAGCANGYSESCGTCSFDAKGKSAAIRPSLDTGTVTGDQTVTFGGTLTVTDDVGTLSIDEPIVKVTLSY